MIKFQLGSEKNAYHQPFVGSTQSQNLTRHNSSQVSTKHMAQSRHSRPPTKDTAHRSIQETALDKIKEEQLKSATFHKQDSSNSPERKSLKTFPHLSRQRPKTALNLRKDLHRQPSSKITKQDSHIQFDHSSQSGGYPMYFAGQQQSRKGVNFHSKRSTLNGGTIVPEALRKTSKSRSPGQAS
jgi:hypothetical protein